MVGRDVRAVQLAVEPGHLFDRLAMVRSGIHDSRNEDAIMCGRKVAAHCRVHIDCHQRRLRVPVVLAE